jgi:hypothetical protein
MKFETIIYDFLGASKNKALLAGVKYEQNIAQKLIEIRNILPDFVKQAIIKRPDDYYGYYQSAIEIYAKDSKAVEYLDNELREWIASGRCMRRCRIEIDEKEISNFSHFHILPFVLSYGNSFIADVKMPDCSIDGCFVGSKLLSPIKIIKRKITGKIDIATLDYPWEKEIVLFLSARMKEIFESEGISGLIYEPSIFIAAAHRKKFVRIDGISKFIHKEIPVENVEFLESPFIARIPHAVYREADWIFTEIRCQTHSVLESSLLGPVNSRIQKKEIGATDFFQVQGVRVHGKTYNDVRNWFYISRKALEILLKNDAKGLHRVGSIIKSKFAPVIEISD